MARWSSWNPVAFTPGPVTLIGTLVYLALFVPLLVVHFAVPAPSSDAPLGGVNLTEAWLDLSFLTNGFHPYNSRRNDEVRNWLLQRLDAILAEENGAALAASGGPEARHYRSADGASAAVVFNDMLSNLTFSAGMFGKPALTTYFEGTNVIVYLRGSEDEAGDWWERRRVHGQGGVLVNAHYDSVSTGFGATDDGVGVVSILQLVKHFTAAGNQPRKGLVALFNNGEEDYLNGARAFARHPVSRFPRTFLNLEGAGAGGRAALFRSTDTEVTKAYRGTKHPFGTVISADGFKRGFIRSQTDYVVFNENLGMRGLDVAFMAPRSRYHTDQDDARHTSVDSIWHMLSAAVHTTRGLTDGEVKEGDSDAVWFDVFGTSFVLFELHTLFAFSVTFLVVTPVFVIAAGVLLAQVDRFYLFSYSKKVGSQHGEEFVPVRGMRGFFRFPFIFIIPTAGAVGLCYLVNRVNPFIAYSSPYAVWSMMLDAWLVLAWAVASFADYVRPSALHRLYSWIWMFLIFWAVLVVDTVFEDHLKIASGYAFVWNLLAVFLATLIGFLELLGVEKKTAFAERMLGASNEAPRPHSGSGNKNAQEGIASSSRQSGPTNDEAAEEEEEEEEDAREEADESTSLIRGPRTTTFANYTSPIQNTGMDDDEDADPSAAPFYKPYAFEQDWSHRLPQWTWLLQLLIAAPVTVILLGQIGLVLTSGTHQTPGDGNNSLDIYLTIAIFSTLLLTPLVPFLHRFTYHVPAFLLLTCLATLLYNLTAFPFSANARLKLYFVQRLDLDTGLNEVGVSSIGSPYMDAFVASLPSTARQRVAVRASPKYPELREYSWPGLPPRVVVPDSPTHPLLPPEAGYADWLSFNVSRVSVVRGDNNNNNNNSGGSSGNNPSSNGSSSSSASTTPAAAAVNEALFRIQGRNTRSCKIIFNRPVAEIAVTGSDADPRFPGIPDAGSREVRLWSREWEKAWEVRVRWWAGDGGGDGGGNDNGDAGSVGLDGRVYCLWNDEDDAKRVIPALEEMRRYAPVWATVTPAENGLVLGSKGFMV